MAFLAYNYCSWYGSWEYVSWPGYIFLERTWQAIVSIYSCHCPKYNFSIKRLCVFTFPSIPSGTGQWETSVIATRPFLGKVTGQLHTLRKFPEIELHHLRPEKDARKAHLVIRKLMKSLDGFPLCEELEISIQATKCPSFSPCYGWVNMMENNSLNTEESNLFISWKNASYLNTIWIFKISVWIFLILCWYIINIQRIIYKWPDQPDQELDIISTPDTSTPMLLPFFRGGSLSWILIQII